MYIQLFQLENFRYSNFALLLFSPRYTNSPAPPSLFQYRITSPWKVFISISLTVALFPWSSNLFLCSLRYFAMLPCSPVQIGHVPLLKQTPGGHTVSPKEIWGQKTNMLSPQGWSSVISPDTPCLSITKPIPLGQMRAKLAEKQEEHRTMSRKILIIVDCLTIVTLILIATFRPHTAGLHQAIGKCRFTESNYLYTRVC